MGYTKESQEKPLNSLQGWLTLSFAKLKFVNSDTNLDEDETPGDKYLIVGIVYYKRITYLP